MYNWFKWDPGKVVFLLILYSKTKDEIYRVSDETFSKSAERLSKTNPQSYVKLIIARYENSEMSFSKLEISRIINVFSQLSINNKVGTLYKMHEMYKNDKNKFNLYELVLKLKPTIREDDLTYSSLKFYKELPWP